MTRIMEQTNSRQPERKPTNSRKLWQLDREDRTENPLAIPSEFPSPQTAVEVPGNEDDSRRDTIPHAESQTRPSLSIRRFWNQQASAMNRQTAAKIDPGIEA